MKAIGKCWPKSAELELYWINKSRDLMCSMMAMVNNTVLNTENFLRE